ncbi:type I-G CRISPR-associated helicase/endonuclease Cas3g, partial [Brevibacterium salitolerans]
MTTSTPFPTFTEFLTAIHGFAPHAWQVDLERNLRETGQWPWHVAVPTGLGKTATIDIAVYDLARQCHVGGTRTAPQRIFHVVDRQRIINSTAAHATLLADRVNGATSGPLKVVRDALAQLRSAGDDLVVAVSGIHGEHPDDQAWMRATGCSIISLTAHQYVSRLLLRGYGVSPGTRSIPAGLCGIDSLVLFDEPHLSVQSVHTIHRVQQLQARASEDLGLPPLHMVLLGATVPPALTSLDHSERGTLILDRESETGPAAAERLAARRTGFLQWVKPTDGEVRKALVTAAKEAWGRNAQRVVVFANTVETAQEVYRDLASQRKTEPSSVVLLTSHSRPIDRAELEGKLVEGPRTVVATQTLEVGVDLTFDELVTEIPSWASLTQRLGRLNRDGTSNDHGRATVVAGWDDEADKPIARKGSAAVYGESTVESATLLLRRQHVLTKGRGIDMGFDGLRAIAASDGFDAMALEGEPTRIATLTESHLPLLAQTRPVPDPDIPVDALISGPDAEQAHEVAVAWRDELSVFDVPKAPRVDPSEYVSVRRHRLDAFLAKLRWNPARGSTASSTLERIRIWNPQQECWMPPRNRADVRSAPSVILSSSLGGYSPALGWTGAPEDVGRLDVSGEAVLRVLRASAEAGRSISADLVLTRSLWTRLTDDDSPSGIKGLETKDLADELALLGAHVADEEDDEELELLEHAARTFAARLAACCGLTVVADRLQVLQSSRRAVVVRFARDAKTKDSAVQTLDEHRRQVAAWSDADAAAAGLSQALADVLLLAGLHHDDGKLRPEWQMSVGGNELAPLARPGRWLSAQEQAARRRACGLEDGWRHEEASVCLLGPAPALLIHLVGSHHGWYRPILPPIRLVSQGDREYSRALGHSDRFAELNQRFGIWGLAYLEAVLRLADWRAAANAVDCTPRAVSVKDLAPDPVGIGASDELPGVHRLEGLRTHPMTGWYAAIGLLVSARKTDPEATI